MTCQEQAWCQFHHHQQQLLLLQDKGTGVSMTAPTQHTPCTACLLFKALNLLQFDQEQQAA